MCTLRFLSCSFVLLVGLTVAAAAELSPKLIAKVDRLILCEPDHGIETKIAYRPMQTVLAEGAEARALLAKIGAGNETLPATGAGFLAHLAGVDESGRPLLLLGIRCEFGITSIQKAANYRGRIVAARWKADLGTKVSREFTRDVYGLMKKRAPRVIASHRRFYTKVGLSLEKLLREGAAGRR